MKYIQAGSLAWKIRTLRKAAGMTLRAVAEKLNVTIATVSGWELRGSIPETPNLIALSEIFNVPLEELRRLIPDRKRGVSVVQGSPVEYHEARPSRLPEEKKTEAREMRVARLCAAVHRIIRDEETSGEIILVHLVKVILPELWKQWEEIGEAEIRAVRDLLTDTLRQWQRRKGAGGGI